MGHHNIYIISALQRLIIFLSCSPENTKEKLHRGGGHYGDICLITIFFPSSSHFTDDRRRDSRIFHKHKSGKLSSDKDKNSSRGES